MEKQVPNRKEQIPINVLILPEKLIWKSMG